jgi:hypothetical protein
VKRQVSHHPATPDHMRDVRVGVYVRRSTDDEQRPYSIEAQDARLAAYIGSQPGWRQAAGSPAMPPAPPPAGRPETGPWPPRGPG